MAKTLLQYSCLYILPFLFGMCLCGLQEEEFLTVATLENKQHFGLGKFLLGKPRDVEKFGRNTQVIVKVEDTSEVETIGKHVSVYMKTNTATMDQAAVGQLRKEVVVEGWVTFPISGNPITVGEDTHYTISVLPGGTKYANIYFEAPVKMFGYKVGSNVRFLANDIETIDKLQNVWNTSDDYKMAVMDDSDNFSCFNVKVDTSSLKVSGGGHILDLLLSEEPTPTVRFDIPL